MVYGVYNAVSLVEERRAIKMKYQDVNKPKKIKVGQLRVWHIPQVPMNFSFMFMLMILKKRD